LGIGGWAPHPNPQSPIPNPQSPSDYLLIINLKKIMKIIINKNLILKIKFIIIFE
jgi:hypothetical protein